MLAPASFCTVTRPPEIAEPPYEFRDGPTALTARTSIPLPAFSAIDPVLSSVTMTAPPGPEMPGAVPTPEPVNWPPAPPMARRYSRKTSRTDSMTSAGADRASCFAITRR